ncbi:MAG: hypothetical protein ACHQRM_07305 [Bacteroidia bacterium]
MKHYVFGLFLLFLLVFPGLNRAGNPLLPVYEDSLRTLARKVFHARTDEAKLQYNTRFTAMLEKALRLDQAFEYPFDSLKDIGRLHAPDGSFNIFNWNIPKEDGTQLYFGFVQHQNAKTKQIDLFPLTDKSADIKNPEQQSLDNKKWFGALYYQVIENKVGKTTYYTLLGWDGNNNLTWKKLIDVLYFDKDGNPHFGEAIFHVGKLPKKRIIFEFRAEMIMALKYEEDKKMIIFDNLVPEAPEGKGIYETYVMDGSYNGLVFKKGMWQFIEDVKALNHKTKNDGFYEDPRAVNDKKGSNNLGPAPKKKN